MYPIILYVLSLIEPSLLFTLCVQAVRDNSTVAIVPYFNDCLTERRRASTYSLFMSFRGFILMLCFVLRLYRMQIVINSVYYCTILELSTKKKRRILYWNTVALYFMIGYNISTLASASFRLNDYFLSHFFFSFCASVLITGFYCAESVVTLQTSPKVDSVLTVRTRILIAFLSILLLLVIGVFTFWSFLVFKGDNFREQRLHWGPDNGGYPQHVIAALFHWIFILLFIPFVFTYVPVISRIHLRETILLDIQSASDNKMRIKIKSSDSFTQ